MATLNRILSASLLFLIRGYRYCLSPIVGRHCRFYPSCSSYALSAIEKYGFWQGSYLIFRRILRCHPWHPGGCDYVPLKK